MKVKEIKVLLCIRRALRSIRDMRLKLPASHISTKRERIKRSVKNKEKMFMMKIEMLVVAVMVVAVMVVVFFVLFAIVVFVVVIVVRRVRTGSAATEDVGTYLPVMPHNILIA